MDRWRGSRPSARRSCYRGDRLPADLYGNVFVAEPAANLVSRIVLTTTGRRCARARRTSGGSSWRQPTSASGRSICRTRPTARCTSSTCIAGSSSIACSLTVYLRDYILARRLEQPTGFGRIYRVVHDTTRRDAPSSTGGRCRGLAGATGRGPVAPERLVPRHRAAPARRALLRALDRRQVHRSDAADAGSARRIRALASERSGRSTGSTRSIPLLSRRRWRTRRGMSAPRRSVLRSDGWARRIIRCRTRC